MAPIGIPDTQTVVAGGSRSQPPSIDGVKIVELGNVMTKSGYMTELFRADWSEIGITAKQVNWVQLNAHGVTDWHCHAQQTDHLVGVGGNIKLALWDGREGSATKGATEIIRFGAARPVLVIVPPGVWHALRNESGMAAGYINVFNEPYDYARPDNFRLVPGAHEIPDIL